MGVFPHPLQVSLHHIPEEHCGRGCHNDLHVPFQGLIWISFNVARFIKRCIRCYNGLFK